MGHVMFNGNSGPTLFYRMTDALGLDLESRELRGALDPADLAKMETACAGCTSPGQCHATLSALNEILEEAPGYCRNKPTLDDWAAQERRGA